MKWHALLYGNVIAHAQSVQEVCQFCCMENLKWNLKMLRHIMKRIKNILGLIQIFYVPNLVKINESRRKMLTEFFAN